MADADSLRFSKWWQSNAHEAELKGYGNALRAAFRIDPSSPFDNLLAQLEAKEAASNPAE